MRGVILLSLAIGLAACQPDQQREESNTRGAPIEPASPSIATAEDASMAAEPAGRPGGGEGPLGAAESGREAGEDSSALMFEPDRLINVAITLEPEDWEALRTQTRTPFDVFGEGCMEAPHGSPFTFFRGSVSVDGELMSDVGVRKKGFMGSLSEERPSLKIKFTEYVEGQTLQGLRRMTLNNSRQDPSYQRQCLTYELFTQAGLIAPRCNWARVSVNGEDLGLYVHVDSIKKPFIRRNYPSDAGTLWEGTLSDFREGWMATFEQKLNTGSDESGKLSAVTTALEADEEALYAALDAHIDMDHFLSFWAMETLTGHRDGYSGNSNNFYVYADPERDWRLTFIPWGADSSFHDFSKEGMGAPWSVMRTGVLANQLYRVQSVREDYHARLQSLLDAIWDEEAIHNALVTRGLWLADHLGSAERAAMESDLDDLLAQVALKRDAVEAELAQGGIHWDMPLRKSPCMERVGEFEVSFTAPLGSLHNADPMQVGSGTFSATLGGETLSFTQVGAAVGYESQEGEEVVTFAVFGRQPNGLVRVIVVHLPAVDYASGAQVPIDWRQGKGGMLLMDPTIAQPAQHVAAIAPGVCLVEEASTSLGGVVSATLSGALYQGPQ